MHLPIVTILQTVRNRANIAIGNKLKVTYKSILKVKVKCIHISSVKASQKVQERYRCLFYCLKQEVDSF